MKEGRLGSTGTRMDSTNVERKDKFIQLPSGIILTKEGLDIISHSHLPIAKMKNHLGIVREGIEASKINAQTLQKMVMNSYVEEIYAEIPEFLNYRQSIMSINSLIVYAILYKKLTPSISEKFFNSPVVKDFNRKNPKNSIVNIQQINRKTMDDLLTKQKDYFDQLKKEIADEVIARIVSNNRLSEEDKKLQTRSLDKFIAWIDQRLWFLYDIISRTNMKTEILRDLGGMIAVYIHRTQIATHLSNLLMELSQNAEKSHFERIVVRNNLCKAGAIEDFLRVKDNRDVVAMLSKKSNELLTLSWNMNPDRNAIGQQYKIKIAITNLGLVDESTRLQINKKMRTDVEGLSIADFYGIGDIAEKLGAGLGLLYNSYLEEYCHEQGIQYRCNIVPDPRNEKTTVYIEISL